MENLSGETLERRLIRGPLPFPDVLRVGAQIASALEAAHALGIVHRDLKPANVMLTAGGATILDFGVAKWQSGEAAAPGVPSATDPTLTQAGMIVGTLHYLAPEQIEGGPIDGRTDLFALGAMLYQMSTGQRAFDGTSTGAVMNAVLVGTPPSFSAAPDVPPAFVRVVHKCLAPDPARRWQTAADLRDELDWLAASTITKHAERPAPRTSRLTAWTVAVVIFVLAAALYAAFARRPVTAARPTTFVVLPPDGVADVMHPTISPDGRTIAFVGATADGHTSLWVRRLETLQARAIADADTLSFPFFSPDSRDIAFFDQGDLKRIAVDGGVAQVLCAASGGRGGAWSRRGLIVFAASVDGPLSVVPATGGTPKRLTALDTAHGERSHRFPQFVDDTRLIYTVYNVDAAHAPVVNLVSVDSPDRATPVLETAAAKTLVASGRLLFSTHGQGTYVAQRFDSGTMSRNSDTAAIENRIIEGPIDGAAAISASDTDVLVYQKVLADRAAHLTWVDRRGQPLATLGESTQSGQPFEFEDMSVSPDGSRIATSHRDATTGSTDIWVLDASHGTAARVTTIGHVEDPRWSPDGTRIAFVAEQHGSGAQDLHIATWRGGWSESPLFHSPAGKYLWDWSRDGRLLFTSQERGNPMWVLVPGEQSPTLFLSSHSANGEARFAPTGRWVAYNSAESGRSEVYVQSFPNPAIRRQVSVNGGSRPRWTADASEIFYVAPTGDMMVVRVREGGQSFTSERPERLFSIPTPDLPRFDYEVAPDGQRLIIPTVIRPSVHSPITVVLNWSSTLPR